YEDKRPRDRYVAEARRLLGVIDAQLARNAWIAGEDFTIADIAILPWVNNLFTFYEASELVGADDFKHIAATLEQFLARPSVQKGLKIP
ncbi:glutathione S-transferase, partial [Acinetobacter baumannii]|nr:glutathione S-transferase [Acinetobacter baumannii]